MISSRTATLFGIGAIALWSLLALLTTATTGLPPLQVLATGFGIAALVGVLVTAAKGRAGWRGWRSPPAAFLLTVVGLFGYHALYFYALKHAPAVEANLINYLWPLLVVLFAALLPGGRLRAGTLAGAVLGLAAAVLIIVAGDRAGAGGGVSSGHIAAAVAAVLWAGYSVLNRRFADVPGSAMVPACLAVAVLGAAAHLLFETTVVPTGGQWLVLVALGLGPVGAAFWLWDRGTKLGDISLLGSLSYLAPLLSTLSLVLAGQARAHWSQAVAIALLLTGAWLSVRTSTRSPTTLDAPA